MSNSVLAPWIGELGLQQQSVLILALRGPDGDKKHTPFKHLLRPYRGTILKAAKFNRMLLIDEEADSFMTMENFGDPVRWNYVVKDFLENEADGSVLHHYTHFMHAAQIIGYKHPEVDYRDRWQWLYIQFCNRLHVNVETEEQMDRRLCDWNKVFWTS
ncbi:hypothetical protein CC53_gp156 [Rhizobium phage vB_RleS_L338C]|uniref:hypothetical protein n=1 Tax=Rhizobium phage vB_RleS_L338C TaxID=1414737 RepID=UPI0003D7DFCC|nr:hypothetical protein CC53_gp156 [Rhizobium phage vB_RleS_L338C]AHC30573.1 hypothetical protein L338C_156 [Rhizobium phage vB_RleS_L338C]QNH72103.1 hypothetical protein P11VFA_164 [Rhizobium phage P11VFA]